VRLEIKRYISKYENQYIYIRNHAFANEVPGSGWAHGYPTDVAATFLAFLDKIAVGFIDIRESENSKAVFDAIGVLRRFRNKGIGRTLMKKAIDWCMKNRIKEISLLAVGRKQERLNRIKNLAESFGFRTIHESVMLRIKERYKDKLYLCNSSNDGRATVSALEFRQSKEKRFLDVVAWHCEMTRLLN